MSRLIITLITVSFLAISCGRTRLPDEGSLGGEGPGRHLPFGLQMSGARLLYQICNYQGTYLNQ